MNTREDRTQMIYLLANLGRNLVSLTCICAAAWLISTGSPHSGWAPFITLGCAGSFEFRRE